ncbi:MAG: hypothetical protein EXR98_09050 [Gemmataceae bacterium]|nr:hypothetical protein [Gemmataceae bacterium]
MSALCPTCGKQSQDQEFCDHCNADLVMSGLSLPPERFPLESGGAVLTLEQRRALGFPEASILIEAEGQVWRVHWVSERDWRERGALLERRLDLQIPALPPGRMVEDHEGRWLVFEAAPASPLPWAAREGEGPLENLQRLSAAVHSLTIALESLHQNSFVWLNFDPNALEDAGPQLAPLRASADWRNFRFTNLDLELFPFQSMPERLRVHPHFAAPEVVQFRVDDIGPRTDVYHLAVFAYYWLAGQLPDGLPGNGPEATDFSLPFLRVFAPELPEGIIPVVMRSLSPNPERRHATPQAFAHAFDESIITAYQRRAYAGNLRWELGGHTRTGRSKSELQRDNEDSIVVKDDVHSALALVADGVSTCDIGSGSLASTMATIAIENAFAEGCTHDTFAETAGAATQRSSQGLLEWAIAQGYRAELVAGKDLMGTTLTLAWLQGRQLSLANLGDSRAYLITAQAVEQLTVDGDLASDLLAQGVPPEEIKELGAMARSLRACVGGCTIGDDGEPSVLPESCTPKVTHWPIIPGDVIMLGTDGLVEEGFFLEPQTLAEIVHANQDRTAAELALMLVEAADQMQRPPSIMEPDGFGDNISCVVIKIKGDV